MAASVLNGFQLKQTVLTNGVQATPATPATFGPVQGTYAASVKAGVTIASYATPQVAATVSVIAFTGAIITCDVVKWDTATSCNGVDAPWASTPYVEFVAAGAAAAVPGSVRAWHFLAEKNADTSKNFQIVKDDKINWIV